MPANIHASEQKLSEVFSDHYALSIPSYQRPYAWGRDQVADLISNLITAMGTQDQPVADLDPYFLGSIVLIKGDVQKSDVVDGQQRLMPLTLLLAVLKNLVPEMARDITGFIYQQGNLITGLPNQYRLRQRERDESFFQSHVQSESGLETLFALDVAQLTDSRKNFQQNAKYLSEKVSELSRNDRIRLLQYL